MKYTCIVGFAFLVVTSNMKVVPSGNEGAVRRISDWADYVPVILEAA